jgi:hypothetical protein
MKTEQNNNVTVNPVPEKKEWTTPDFAIISKNVVKSGVSVGAETTSLGAVLTPFIS